MAFDLKAATPDTTFAWATAGLFGADSQVAASPSYFPAADVRAALLALASTWAADGAASTPAQLLSGTWFTGGSSTTTKPQLLVEPAGTISTGWSTAGTGFGVNAPSGFTGNLIDIQLNGLSRFKQDSTGLITFTGGAISPAGLLILSASGSEFCRIGNTQHTAPSGTSYAFTSSASSCDSSLRDVFLHRDAAGSLALRNSTNAQALRVYSTFTDSSNYERGAINAGADYIELAAETAGTGDDNLDVRLTPAGTGNASFPGGVLLKTRAALTDGAGASAGTLANAPSVGNPTKWIPINDNGTTRHIPAW